MTVVLSGIQPSGTVHVGNYLGMIREAVTLSKQSGVIMQIVDMHALTSCKSPKDLRNNIYDLAATLLACGFDTSKTILFCQSELRLHGEMTWILSCVTGMGLLEKGHAYKDALAKGDPVSVGKFSYPLLMAADILLYDADIVPVGKDQKQHVEFARDIAGAFNAAYGENLLKLPTPLIKEDVMTVPGLDGRKMSKSYNNTIPLFCDEKSLRKLVLSLQTDSSPLEAPKQLAGTLMEEYLKCFSTPAHLQDLSHRLAQGGLGWGHAKQELFEAMNTTIAPMRARYLELRDDRAMLDKVLADGAERGFAIAYKVLQRVREAVGLRNHLVRG